MKSLTDTTTYIGCDDAELDLFESQYPLPKGMCYNSYVILDDKVAVMDTSDKRTLSQWHTNLTEALKGRRPDYLVVHHLEPDHSSGIRELIHTYPDIKIVCSAKAVAMMPQFFPQCDFTDRVIVVKEGDTLCLGQHQLHFYMAPMVHWPEVMITYDAGDKHLFSADAFGKFGVMDADPDDWACEARRYYFNICGKYGVPVSNLLKKISALEIKQILPLHGPILRGTQLTEALRLYQLWSSYAVESEGVFIACSSIHGCTRQAVDKLADILRTKGCKKVVVTDLCRSDQSEAVEDAFRYGKIVLASSSYDSGLFPPMQEFLLHLQAKAWQNREVAVIENGSWAPSAARVMTQMLGEMKNITLKSEPVTLRGVMKETDIAALETLADALLQD